MDQYKEQIKEKIVHKLIEATDAGQFTDPQLAEISQFVLDHIEPVQTHDQLIGFLHTLSLKWPIFSSISLSEEGVVKKKVEQHITNNVLRLIKEEKFDQAVATAQSLPKS